MSTKKNALTLIVVFGLWLGLVLGCSSFRKAVNEKRAEREGTGINISAEDLYKAYEANEAEAEKLYQGKVVIVTGTVGTSSAGTYGNPAVILIDAREKPIVNCFGFAKDYKEAIAKLKTGQKVRVTGKCMGKVTTAEPTLEDCILQ